MPAIQSFVDLLSQSTCSDGDVCIPCVNPLDGQDTGVCGAYDCSPDAVPPPPPPEPLSCDNRPTKPVLDVSIFAECCEDAHCIPNGFVPEGLSEVLTQCPGETAACIPDQFVETGGFFTPELCTAPGDMEGRCLSSCLAFVEEQSALFSKQTCEGNNVCVPCCDPFTGTATGACEIGCDTGLQEGVCEVSFTDCCGGVGNCVPDELIPEDYQEYLSDKECEDDGMCVPDVFLDPTVPAIPCTGNVLLVVGYSGVCLPRCIELPFDFFIGSGSCEGANDCVPCEDPFSKAPTGAPGC